MKSSIVVALLAICFVVQVAGATEVDSGPVSGKWDAAGNPYNINGEITVPASETLTINEGVEVVFQGHYKLIVNGYLEAVGTENSPILFTAADTMEGWHSIRFIDAPDTSHLTWCIIEYGSAIGVDMEDFDGWGGGIFCYNSSPVLNHCIIRENFANWLGGGFSSWESNTELTDCTITSNSCTYEAGGGFGYLSNLVLRSCEIRDNVAYGTAGFSFQASTTIVEDCTVIGNSSDYWGGGLGGLFGGHLTVRNCSITGNSAGEWGGGIAGDGGPDHDVALTITGNLIKDNYAGYRGGGVFTYNGCTGTISNNFICENEAGLGGGGILLWWSCSMDITNNLIFGNLADVGAGIHCLGTCTANLKNVTIFGNSATDGGGILAENYCDVSCENTILWSNSATGDGKEIHIGNDSMVTVGYSDIDGGMSSIHGDCDWGPGMITDDPEFCEGKPVGDYYQYYLSNEACGEPVNSPCLEKGNPMSQLVQGATRTDLEQDWGAVDMGFHYPREIQPFVTSGPGPGYENSPRVRVFPPAQDAEHLFEFSAYGAPHFGVNVSCGDVNANQMNEIITGAAPGEIYGPHVRGFQADGSQLPGLSFLAYGTNKWGVNVAAGDIDGDNFDEIITGAGPGAVFGPHVRGWDYDGSGSVTAIPGVSFFAYGTPKWGVNVACGDIDGDGYDEIVTGAGPGAVYGPHVRGWDYDGAPPVTPIPGCSFFAYGTLKFGVNVTCGDMDGDGIDEIITGAGPGAVFAPHVRGWNYDGASVAPLSGLSFFAWDDMRYGANVYAGADLNGDGRAELVVGCGPDLNAGTEVKVYEYNGSGETLWFSLDAFEGMTHGTNVAAGSF